MLDSKRTLTIYCDGGARGNPGPAAIGVVVYQNGELVTSVSKFVGETVTNNQAEYLAVIESLQQAKKLGAYAVRIRLDSQLIQRQLMGKYKVKNVLLQELWQRVVDLQEGFKEVRFDYIPRRQNKEADRLVNQALDGKLK